MLVFNNIEEIEKYYNEETNTYEFYENGKRQDVKFNFDLSVNANIIADNIGCMNIKAYNIEALNINADNINYYAFCIAYQSLKCKSIRGRRDNCIHKCLDKEIEYIIDDLEEKVNKILDCSECKFAACEQCEISYNDKQKIKKYIELLKGGN